ncbi:hypothetical protein BT69DRAFT_1281059 [Atractiella rhizophila]|nr:hypothetical protein BT69DRAFT_1281059 [Atractiella rhizophila]
MATGGGGVRGLEGGGGGERFFEGGGAGGDGDNLEEELSGSHAERKGISQVRGKTWSEQQKAEGYNHTS